MDCSHSIISPHREFAFTHLKLSQEPYRRLMPMIMTMNGDHQSAAIAPLDLRTTNRERGSSRSKTPDCKGRAGDTRVTGGSTGALGRTGTEDLGRKTPPLLSSGASSALSAPLNNNHCPVAGGALGVQSLTDKRTKEKSSSKLPFRKRPFRAEPDIQTGDTRSALPETADRFSLAEDPELANSPSPTKRLAAGEDRICVAPRRFEEVGQSRDGHPMHFMHALNPYRKRCSNSILQ